MRVSVGGAEDLGTGQNSRLTLWMLCCNGSDVTFEVFSRTNNNSIVWRWVLCESFGILPSPGGPGPRLGQSLSTFGRSSKTVLEVVPRHNYKHARFHSIRIKPFCTNTK